MSSMKILIMDLGEGLHCGFAMPNSFVLTNKICLNQNHDLLEINTPVFSSWDKVWM